MAAATRVRAILFDHDGTLVDSEPEHLRLWNTLLAPRGVQLTEAQYKALYAGMPTAANAVDIAARFHLPDDPAALAEAKNAATRAHLAEHAFPLMPRTRDVLATFHAQGLHLAVVTGASTDAVQATLRSHALGPYFDTVVSADDVVHSKPAPDCYLLAARRLGLDPADCLAIEDTEHGLQAAADAGVRCIAIPTPMTVHHDFRRAVVVLRDLGDVAGWISSGGGDGASDSNRLQRG